MSVGKSVYRKMKIKSMESAGRMKDKNAMKQTWEG